MSGGDIGAQGNHCGWNGQGMLCTGGRSWAGFSRIGCMWVVGAQWSEAFRRTMEEREVAWKRNLGQNLLDRRLWPWITGWVPEDRADLGRLWKNRPKRKLGLSCESWRAESFWEGKRYDKTRTLEKSQTFLPDHIPLIQAGSPYPPPPPPRMCSYLQPCPLLLGEWANSVHQDATESVRMFFDTHYLLGQSRS